MLKEIHHNILLSVRIWEHALFEPVDKSVPYRYYEKRFWYLTSISVGLSLGEIKNNEFKDSYNSMSLMVGANFKLTQELSLSTVSFF